MILYTCNTCDTWRLRDFIRVIRVIRGDLCGMAIWDYHECPSRAILVVNFTDMTICSTAIVYYLHRDCEASATAVHHRRDTADCLSPPLHPSALPLPSPLGVELGWSQTGVRVEIGWRNPHLTALWTMPFSSCKETTFMLRPRCLFLILVDSY